MINQLYTVLASFQIRGVINFCEEFKGPVEKYKKLGIQQLYLPTTDHFEPSIEDLEVRLLAGAALCNTTGLFSLILESVNL